MLTSTSRFPLFHQPTLLQNVRDQAYLRDRGCFVSTMAACALASARRRDGAMYSTSNDASCVVTIPSETFYAAVVDTLPKDLTVAREFDYLRACALLSITSIQYGDIAAMQLYLGHYFTLVGIHRFHDETCWPKNISNIEVEERRRLVGSPSSQAEAIIDTCLSIGRPTRWTFTLRLSGTVAYIPVEQTPVCVTQLRSKMNSLQLQPLCPHCNQLDHGYVAGTLPQTCI